MLYRPEAFEALTDERWDEERVRASIREIVADTDDALRGPKLLWRADDWDRWQATSPMKNLYVGAAGALWALDELRRLGHAETRLDLAELALRNLELFGPDRLNEDRRRRACGSRRFFGETGVLLVAWRLAPSREFADDLLDRVRANTSNEAEEVMWGTPGTMIAARTMLEWTDDERWRTAWEESADALWSRRGEDGSGCNDSTVARSPTSVRRTGWSGTCRRSCRSSMSSAAPLSNAIRPRSSSGRRMSMRTCELAARGTPGAARAGWSDPCPVVPRRTRDHLVGGRLSGRGADPRRSRADVARGAAT